MATYSTGIAVSWGGTPFVEVQELSFSIGGTRTGRAVAYPSNQGSVAVTCLNTTNAVVANFGIRDELVITGGGAGFSTYAVWESVSVAPERNGVTKYTVSFRILDS